MSLIYIYTRIILYTDRFNQRVIEFNAMANVLFQDRILAAAFLELGAELCMFSWLVVVALVLYKCVVKRFFGCQTDRRVFFDGAC